MKRAILNLATAVLIFVSVGSAHGAMELVANGSFEDPPILIGLPITDWTVTGGDSPSVTSSLGGAADGNSYFQTGALSGNPTILSQMISTTAGDTYLVSFYTAVVPADNPDSSLTVSFGSLNQTISNPRGVLSGTSSPNTWHQYSFSTVAATSTTALTFSLYDNPASIAVDNISVTDITPAGAAPEPASIVTWLSLIGVAGVGWLRRRAAILPSPA